MEETRNFLELIDKEILINCVGYLVIQKYPTKSKSRRYNIFKSDKFERVPTNNLLNNFFQTIYHAGTPTQFFNSLNASGNILDISTTFHYLFDILKKGIYVEIKDGKLTTYLPFSNTNYTNDWGQYLKIDEKYSNMGIVGLQKDIVKYYKEDANYKTKINDNLNKWYANNGIFRNTVYDTKNNLNGLDDEGDKSITNFLELLTRLLLSRKIPDVYFFINPRDFPVLKKDLTHPYKNLYPESKVPDYSNKYPKNRLMPIFSQSTTDEYDDILIPNDDDIKNILKESKNYFKLWNYKTDKAVFRGSATGLGTSPESNQRLKLIEISKNNRLIDAKLTGLNNKLKLDPLKKKISVIDQKKYQNFKEIKGNFLTPNEQSGYKYIIHVQGHVSAFRLTNELSYGSLILMVDNPWNTWYSGLLVKDVHYIKIKSDLSDLVETVNWCKLNDDKCKKIALNAYQFWEKHLKTSTFMFDELAKKFENISKIQRSINDKPKGIIIIPYRNDVSGARKEQLEQLVEVIKNEIKMDYYVAKQEDDELFNRGLLLNQGYVKHKNDYDYFIFHDVDLIPDKDLIHFYHEYPRIPIHLGHRGQRYTSNGSFIGGVYSINKFDFETANGFPNNFKGWGGEDDALYRRLKNKGITHTFPSKGSVTDLEKFKTWNSKNENLKLIDEKIGKVNEKNYNKVEGLKEDKTSWENNGLSNLHL